MSESFIIAIGRNIVDTHGIGHGDGQGDFFGRNRCGEPAYGLLQRLLGAAGKRTGVSAGRLPDMVKYDDLAG